MTTERGALTGLEPAEAAARLAAEEPNALAHAGPRSVLRIALEVLREPMLLLLLLGGGAYLLLGSLAEALILLAFATFTIAVMVIQKTRTEHVLEALRDLSAPRALVIRGGARLRIPRREVVRGDLIVLEQGDRIAADARLVEAHDLQADESLLTGESLPVGKVAAEQHASEAAPRPDRDSLPFLYSGSLVTRGSGIARVLATGPHSEIGRIGQSLAGLETEAPRLRREATRIVTWCTVGGGAVALAVVVLFSLRMTAWSVFQGGTALALLATVLFAETANGMPETELRALMFFALIAAVLALTFVNRSFSASWGDALLRPNAALRVVLLAVTAITGAILFIPAAQTLLKFGMIAWSDMALAAGLGMLLLCLLEAGKFALGRFLARRGERAMLFREDTK